MSFADPAYDPGPDLEALRASRGAKVAIGFMLVAAVFELGSFLQFVFSYVVGPAWVSAWVWAKLGLVLLALYASHAVANLHHRALAIWGLVSVLVLVDGLAWFVFSWSNGFFSIYAPLVAVPAFVAVLASGVVRSSVARADEARRHLRESGLGDGF